LLGFLEQRKQDRHNFFRGDPAVQLFLGQDKLLSTKRTDWDHHPSARLELIDQGSWDQIGRRRDGSTRLSNAVLPIWVATCSVCALIAAINCRLCSSKYSTLMSASHSRDFFGRAAADNNNNLPHLWRRFLQHSKFECLTSASGH
jgi:hypothetical protein